MTQKRQKRNPFRGLMDVNSEMARMVDRMHGLDSTSGTETQPRGYMDAWTPAADIFARGDDLVVRVDVSGVTRDEVEVSFSNGTLSVSGQRQADDDDSTVYYTRERGWGQFRRSITLPEGVGSDDIAAELDEGLLRVTIRGGAAVGGPAEIKVASKRKPG